MSAVAGHGRSWEEKLGSKDFRLVRNVAVRMAMVRNLSIACNLHLKEGMNTIHQSELGSVMILSAVEYEYALLTR